MVAEGGLTHDEKTRLGFARTRLLESALSLFSSTHESVVSSAVDGRKGTANLVLGANLRREVHVAVSLSISVSRTEEDLATGTTSPR